MKRRACSHWLLAGLAAGVISGAITWVISLVYKNVYVAGLGGELTTFAAFTALMVFLPAITAVAIGRWLVDRSRPDEPRRRVTDGVESDVFDAAREDDQTAPVGAGAAGEAVDYPEDHGKA